MPQPRPKRSLPPLVVGLVTMSVAMKNAPRKSPPGKPVKRKAAPKSTYKSPTYADSTLADNVDGEDLVVRRAAVEALGLYNGAVVVTDANTGRILAIVNQPLAFKSGFQPCSIVKLVTSLASLNERIIERTTPFRVSRRLTLDLTSALAHSNLSNGYFASLGTKLGFDRVLSKPFDPGVIAECIGECLGARS